MQDGNQKTECRRVIRGLRRVRSPRPPSGLTVVEVLVAVAVVGLLLSLLLPAFGRARDSANLVLCRARLRNLTTGCLIYAQDHDARLPVEQSLDNPHPGLMGALSTLSQSVAVPDFYCPSERTPERWGSAQNIRAGNIGYFYYSFRERPADRLLSNFLLKSVPCPRMLQATMAPDTWVFSDSWFSSVPTAHRWYPKGINYAVLDGSVSMVTQSPRRSFK
jgi:type II secretory pathway pseudopilin PulG